MKRKEKKLSLGRETIVQLTTAQVGKVMGGATPTTQHVGCTEIITSQG